MRLLLLSVVVLAAVCGAVGIAPSTNADIQDLVFEKWCKASAVTEYESALVAFNAKHEAWTKSAANTATLFTKYDAAHEAFSAHKETIAKTEHKIASLTKRIALWEKKKATTKRNLHDKYDTINWASEKAQIENVITSTSGLHDKTTVDLVVSALKNSAGAITRTQARILAIEARIDAFEKDKRDFNANFATLHASSARLSDVHNYTKTAWSAAKKFSDGAESSFKEAQNTLTSTANHVNACVNKGFLPADAAVNAAAAIAKAAAGTKAALEGPSHASESSHAAESSAAAKKHHKKKGHGKHAHKAAAGPKRHRRHRSTHKKQRTHRARTHRTHKKTSTRTRKGKKGPHSRSHKKKKKTTQF